jgi:GNAT superfamily N-acetyltransferase
MNIRWAMPQDMQAVLNLIRELAVYEKEPQAVIISVEDLIRDGFGDFPLFQTLVAEVEYNIIGMALFYTRYSTWKGKTIHLEDLIVTEEFRGTGVGFALYQSVIQHGFEIGVRRIEWNVLNWNQSAIEFYEKSGAKILEDWRVVHLDEKSIQNFIKNNIKD